MNIQDIIQKRAIAMGVDPTAATAIAKIESGFNPTANQNAQTKYKGLFQLGPDEWSKYGNGDIYDPTANTDAFLKLYKDNTAQLAQNLGRQPTAAEAYLAHQQGVAGANALLSNPDQNAVDAIAQYYPNRKTAIAAIQGNGGDPNGTAGDFVNFWNNKYSSVGTGPAASYQEAGAPANANANANASANAASDMPLPGTPGLLSANPMSGPTAGLTQQGLSLLAQYEPQMHAPPAPAAQIHRGQFGGFTGLLG
jgi:Transglycosylase SLT domain